MGKIYNNVPYEEVEELVEKDLEKYGQWNRCPKSLTILEGELWRHYELGAIVGFVIYNEKDADGDDRFFIASLNESDETWFAPVVGLRMSSAWINDVNRTWQRMVDWYNDHIIEGFPKDSNPSNPNEYVHKTIKEIVPEVVEWEGIPDNHVLRVNTIDD